MMKKVLVMHVVNYIRFALVGLFVLLCSGAGYTLWVDSDGAGKDSANILEGSTILDNPYLSLDGQENPFIVWQGEGPGNFEINLLRWSETGWVDADGSGRESTNISGTLGPSENPCLSLDKFGNIHVAWEDYDENAGKKAVFYLKRTGEGWTKNILVGPGSSFQPSLCVDGNGNAHIAWKGYVSGDNYDVYYAKWNGETWVDCDGFGQESINISDNNGYSGFPSLVLDSLDNPHIAWMDSSSRSDNRNDIYYMRLDGERWVDVTGSPSRGAIAVTHRSEDFSHPSLAVDPFGYPHIVCDKVKDGSYEIAYFRWDGSSWVDGFGGQAIDVVRDLGYYGFPRLKLDNSGYPHISFTRYSQGRGWDIYYLRWNGSVWVSAEGEEGVENISQGSGDSYSHTFWIDGFGCPHIAWVSKNGERYGLYYLRWNNPPVLTWVGDGGYKSDGLEPETGEAHTVFTYRIKYIDADNHPPLKGYPKIHIKKGGGEIPGSPFSMLELDPGDKNYRDGKIYYFATLFSPGANYSYYFEAKDKCRTPAEGPATLEMTGPIVTNRVPVLAWTGEDNFAEDGLHPETGHPTTQFVYRVKYLDEDNDAPATGYPRLHILRAQSDIAGSPFPLTEADPTDTDFTDGKIYSFVISGLQEGTDYGYYFEAEDIWGERASGPPTSLHYGPSVTPVTNSAPELSWTGEMGYEEDGLQPETGLHTLEFIYRVKYSDKDNDSPEAGYPKVHILKGGDEVKGSPFSMVDVDPADISYNDGKVYSFSQRLTPGNDYSYYFEAKDRWGKSAIGPPNEIKAGPVVTNSSPVLSWTGEKNFTRDGLDPESGYPMSQFVYRVKYTDPDNDPPLDSYPKVHIRKGDKEIKGSPFSMKEVNPRDKNYVDGKLYTVTISGLEPGDDYTSVIEAKDTWGGKAGGEAGQETHGPSVTPIRFSGTGEVKIRGGENGYVNPLKGEVAEIHFWPTGSGEVKVEIFDLRAFLIWQERKKVTGSPDFIVWNCRNKENSIVASGIYVVFVEGPGIEARKKVCVMK